MLPGAQVLLNNVAVGTTPCVIGVRPEQTTHEVRVTMDGWQATSRKVGEIAGEWRWQAAMARTTRWQVNLGKPINSLMMLADGGVLALSGEVLHRLSADGKTQWRTSIAAVDINPPPECPNIPTLSISIKGTRRASCSIATFLSASP